MNILFVDDELRPVKTAMKHLQDYGYSCEYSTFEEFDPDSKKFDIIVIDMIKGKAADDPQGDSGKFVINQIWGTNFCPIIIFSADPSLANLEKHPLIAKIQKGSGSHERILAATKRMALFVDAKREIIKYAGHAVKRVLQDTVPAFFSELDNERGMSEEEEQILRNKVTSVFPRIIRRRIAADFDSGYNTRKLLPYELYLFPPIGDNWLQGDIVKNPKDNSILLVLTPSCDLVRYSTGLKTHSILCAKCLPFDMQHICGFFQYSLKAKGCDKCNTCDIESVECKKKRLGTKQREEQIQFISLLNSGLIGDYYFLPALPGIIDNMLADLKNLFTFPAADINNYERLISIDSPFREKLNEAFIRIAGRIGLPDRDFEEFTLRCIPREKK